ncbi:CRE-BATH-38 protein [Aphelenchoides avenae]|nr:CRE-BATH-38 protein [Aphelenchus avenae]
MPGPTIKYQKAAPAQGDRLSLRINGISTFLANPHSVIESKKVEIGGVQWYAVAKTFVENGTTYLAYYLRGTKDGDWRRWLSAQIGLRTPTTGYSYKLLPNEMRTASAEDAYAEWGCDTFISKEELLGPDGFVCNDFLYLGLTVGGQPVFVNKDLLSLHSPVFEQLFKERVGEKEIALQDNDLMGLLHFLCVIYPPHEKLNAATVTAVYQMAKAYGVDYLLEKCDKHIA